MLLKYWNVIETLTLIPSSGRIFEVIIGDELVFSKKALGRHPAPGEIAAIVEEKTAWEAPPPQKRYNRKFEEMRAKRTK